MSLSRMLPDERSRVTCSSRNCAAASEEGGTHELNMRYQAYQRLACLRRSGRTRSKAEQTPTLREFAKSTTMQSQVIRSSGRVPPPGRSIDIDNLAIS